MIAKKQLTTEKKLKKNRGPGRPKSAEAKNNRVWARLTDAEYDAVTEARGLTPEPDFVRQAVLEKAGVR